MFESFRNFVAEFVEGDKHPQEFADNDYRLAAVALLVHAAGIDGNVSPRERDALHAVVKRHFDLDGERDELEDNLLWRAADLLGVSPRERIELRQRIANETGEPGDAGS